MNEEIVNKILCTTGYLPPRNEEEMECFERVYSKVEIDEEWHIDVDSIINGSCCLHSVKSHIEKTIVPDNDMRMAARNFNKIPSDVIEKIKKQHLNHHDKDK